MKVNIQAKYVKTGKEKIIGLIGSSKPYPLMFKTRFGIHTFGLRFPIDVLILDKNFKVFFIKQNLLPYRFYFWNPRYNGVLELPSGTINLKNIKKGDVVYISPFR